MVTTALAIREDKPQSLVPDQHEMQVFYTMAETAVESKFYKHIGDKSAVMMILLAARELGVPPMMALNKGIQMIQGSMEISPRLMNALMRRAGIHIKVIETNAKKCILRGTRPNGETEEVSYTIEEAQIAGLVKAGGSWTKIPKDMCYNRCMSRLGRILAPDIIGLSYVEGEVSEAKGEMFKHAAEPLLMEEDPQPVLLVDSIVRYLNIFPAEEREDANKYLDAVKDHFGWTVEEGCAQMLKDVEKTKTKFYAWRKTCAQTK